MKPYDMGVLFDECAERGQATRVHLDRPFDIAPAGGVAYGVAELAELVREASGWIAAAGARPGDRVAIVKDNHWDYDLLACAAIRIGAVPAQIHDGLPAESLDVLLGRLRPSVLLTTAAVVGRLRRAGLPPHAARVVTLDEPTDSAVHLDDLRGSTPPPPRTPRRYDPLVINHTSGTTGIPKLVTHSTDTIICKLAGLESIRLPLLSARHDDTVVNANAFTHGRTFCWTAVVLSLAPRAIGIITDSDPDTADPVLRAHPPTIIEAMPASFVRFRPLLSRVDNPFRDVRLFLSTYDAVHPPTVRAYLRASRRRYPLWMQGWGQTETGPLTFRFFSRKSLAAKEERHPGTRDLGRPIPGRARLRVVDPVTFEPVRRGRPGLVLTRTPAICGGYVGEQERWAAKTSGTWFNTGDIGVHKRSGSVLLLDREVDHPGELSCLEIEDVLEDRLPEASECVLLGLKDRPPLPVVVTADGRLDRQAWRHAVRDLPAMTEPTVVTWEQIPRTGTGKVRRFALREQLLGSTEAAGSGRWT